MQLDESAHYKEEMQIIVDSDVPASLADAPAVVAVEDEVIAGFRLVGDLDGAVAVVVLFFGNQCGSDL